MRSARFLTALLIGTLNILCFPSQTRAFPPDNAPSSTNSENTRSRFVQNWREIIGRLEGTTVHSFPRYLKDQIPSLTDEDLKSWDTQQGLSKQPPNPASLERIRQSILQWFEHLGIPDQQHTVLIEATPETVIEILRNQNVAIRMEAPELHTWCLSWRDIRDRLPENLRSTFPKSEFLGLNDRHAPQTRQQAIADWIQISTENSDIENAARISQLSDADEIAREFSALNVDIYPSDEQLKTFKETWRSFAENLRKPNAEEFFNNTADINAAFFQQAFSRQRLSRLYLTLKEKLNRVDMPADIQDKLFYDATIEEITDTLREYGIPCERLLTADETLRFREVWGNVVERIYNATIASFQPFLRSQWPQDAQDIPHLAERDPTDALVLNQSRPEAVHRLYMILLEWMKRLGKTESEARALVLTENTPAIIRFLISKGIPILPTHEEGLAWIPVWREHIMPRLPIRTNNELYIFLKHRILSQHRAATPMSPEALTAYMQHLSVGEADPEAVFQENHVHGNPITRLRALIALWLEHEGAAPDRAIYLSRSTHAQEVIDGIRDINPVLLPTDEELEVFRDKLRATAFEIEPGTIIDFTSSVLIPSLAEITHSRVRAQAHERFIESDTTWWVVGIHDSKNALNTHVTVAEQHSGLVRLWYAMAGWLSALDNTPVDIIKHLTDTPHLSLTDYLIEHTDYPLTRVLTLEQRRAISAMWRETIEAMTGVSARAFPNYLRSHWPNDQPFPELKMEDGIDMANLDNTNLPAFNRFMHATNLWLKNLGVDEEEIQLFRTQPNAERLIDTLRLHRVPIRGEEDKLWTLLASPAAELLNYSDAAILDIRQRWENPLSMFMYLSRLDEDFPKEIKKVNQKRKIYTDPELDKLLSTPPGTPLGEFFTEDIGSHTPEKTKRLLFYIDLWLDILGYTPQEKGIIKIERPDIIVRIAENADYMGLATSDFLPTQLSRSEISAFLRIWGEFTQTVSEPMLAGLKQELSIRTRALNPFGDNTHIHRLRYIGFLFHIEDMILSLPVQPNRLRRLYHNTFIYLHPDSWDIIHATDQEGEALRAKTENAVLSVMRMVSLWLKLSHVPPYLHSFFLFGDDKTNPAYIRHKLIQMYNKQLKELSAMNPENTFSPDCEK